MAGISTLGQYRFETDQISANNPGGTVLNSDGPILELFPDGPIAFTNFFRSSGINPAFNGNGVPGTLYYQRIECALNLNDSNCQTVEFRAFVDQPPDFSNTDNRLFEVKGYAELIFAGTKFGIAEETIGQPQWIVSSNGYEYVEQDRAIALTCYPAFTNDLPDTNLCVNIDEVNHIGTERDVMIESWFHDTQSNVLGVGPNGEQIQGTLNNVIGNSSQSTQFGNAPSADNIILEQMLHIGPIGFNSPLHSDSGGGLQNPAQYYCSDVTMGGWDWEIWFGWNGNHPLVVYNRIGGINLGVNPNQPQGISTLSDLTSEGDINIDYTEVLEFSSGGGLQAALEACYNPNIHTNAGWISQAAANNPFVVFNEPGRAAAGGIEIGLEPYYNSENNQEFGFDLNKLVATVDDKVIGTCRGNTTIPDSGDIGDGIIVDPNRVPCRFNVQLNEFGRCFFPVQFEGNFGCGFDVGVDSAFNKLTADCVSCPEQIEMFRSSVPYGSGQRRWLVSDFVDFPENTQVLITSLESSGLAGLITFTDIAGVFYNVPSDLEGCETNCGRAMFTYDYRCPDTDNMVNEWIRGCKIEFEICSFPSNQQLQDETITVAQGVFPLIRTNGVEIAGEEICPPAKGPRVGSLDWEGNGYRFNYPPGVFGRFEVIVPSHPNGAKAHDSMRRVTICVIGPAALPLPPACRAGMFFRDKNGVFQPAVRIKTFALQIESVAPPEYEEFNECRTKMPLELYQTWQGSMTGELMCGDRDVSVGRDIDIMFMKNVTDSTAGAFFGTARISNASMAFTARNSAVVNDDGENDYTLTLAGHGDFWTSGWQL